MNSPIAELNGPIFLIARPNNYVFDASHSHLQYAMSALTTRDDCLYRIHYVIFIIERLLKVQVLCA